MAPPPSRADSFRLHLVVLRAQAGDERAFRQLFELFGEGLERYLRNLLGDAAEDVQQEVWLAVYRNIVNLTDPRALRTWLYRTARHRAIDHLRRQRRERELEAVFSAEFDPHCQDADPPSEIDPAELETQLRHLSSTHREVLTLKYYDDLTYDEIAGVLGCSIGTVRSRLHHAKRKLLDVLRSTNQQRKARAK